MSDDLYLKCFCCVTSLASRCLWCFHDHHLLRRKVDTFGDPTPVFKSMFEYFKRLQVSLLGWAVRVVPLLRPEQWPGGMRPVELLARLAFKYIMKLCGRCHCLLSKRYRPRLVDDPWHAAGRTACQVRVSVIYNVYCQRLTANDKDVQYPAGKAVGKATTKQR